MSRKLLVLMAVACGACAHTQPPMAPQSTQERWERIMQQMRRDSAEAARHATSPELRTSSLDDSFATAGIDLARFELPIQYNERVQQYIDLYATRRRSVFVSWLERMGRYRGYIEERLAAYGLPKELVYLPLIESGYQTGAKSSASAVGLWQFMSGTARAEGLEVSEFVDERRDPFKSTDAAVRHLSGLYQTFGSWYLAAAAYNSGSGRIGRLMKETYGQVKGSDDSFWSIQDAVPDETRSYVPQLIAATIVGENPDVFGLDPIDADPPVRYESVTVPGATDLRAVARAAGTTAGEIEALNPQYIRGMTPPDRESVVRVPPGTAGDFETAFHSIPKQDRTVVFARTHIVKKGETLSEIAERYGTSVSDLQTANRIKRPDAIAVGRKLTIPVRSEAYGSD